jgi:hypothetical protein
MKAIKMIVLVTLAGLAISAFSQTHPNSRTKFHNLNDDLVPLFVFTYLDPWLEVYGSDSPKFVLYEDGTLIFDKCREADNPYSCSYRTVKFSSNEIADILEKLRSTAFYSFADKYVPDMSNSVVSDLTTRVLVMRRQDGNYKKIWTYGTLTGGKSGFAAEGVPAALIDIVEFAASYDSSKAVDLDPEYFEVIFEPYYDDSSKNIKWPKNLPGLTDPKTITHKKYGRLSMLLDSSLFKPVIQIAKKQRRSGSAILLNSKRWKLAEIRLPFPSESVWLGDFRNE